MFGQVPLLEIDGLKLVQTGAIVRYLARKHGMYGINNVESARLGKLTNKYVFKVHLIINSRLNISEVWSFTYLTSQYPNCAYFDGL